MKSLSIFAAIGIAWLCLGSPALAQAPAPGPAKPAATDATPTADGATPAAAKAAGKEDPGHYLSFLGVAIGVGFIISGAAYGISRIAAAAMESMARQPEVSANIQMSLIITTAMIEGITFFGLIICLLELFT